MEMNKHGQSNSNTGGLNTCSTIPLYSTREAEALAGKLLKKETFREAVQVLITWLESGQCNESNSVQFHALIQLCWNYMEKLQNEREEFLGKAQKAQENLNNKNCCIQLQLNKIEGLFRVIEKENIWGNFTEAQIQEFQEMRKEIEDLKQNCPEGIKTEEAESSSMADMGNQDVQSENVVHEVPTKAGSLNAGEKRSENLKDRCKEYENEILKLQSELESRKKAFEVHQNEIKIISLVSCVLFDNPDGLNIDSIYSHFLNRSIPVSSAREIEEVMRKNPKIFRESSPIEASKEKKWTCISINQETMALLKEQ